MGVTEASGVAEVVGVTEVVGVAETEEPTGVTESTDVDGFTRLMVPSDASCESSTSFKANPVAPVPSDSECYYRYGSASSKSGCR